MPLDSVHFLPHGAMLLNLELEGLPKEAERLHFNVRKAATECVKNIPETIIILSPHGFALRNLVSICLNRSVSGSAEWLGEWSQYRVDFQTDLECARSLLAFLNNNSASVEGISIHSEGNVAPIAWGEVIPLWFVEQACIESNLTKPRVVIVSWPKAIVSAVSYMKEAQKFGELLSQFCESYPSRVSVIFSGDLSHLHSSPIGTRELFQCIPGMFSPDSALAEKFDRFAVEWATQAAESKLNESRNKLSELAELSQDAYACGWASICALQNLLESSKLHWSGKMHDYAAPTYFGMMVLSISFDSQ